MRKNSDAQRKSVKKYRAKFKYLNCRFEEAEYNQTKEEAASLGLSLNAYVLFLIRERRNHMEGSQPSAGISEGSAPKE